MTTKYAVMTETFEFNPTSFATPKDAWFAESDHDNKQIALCDSLEEAKAILDTVDVSTHRYSDKLASATVAFIEKSTYDLNENDEWEFVEGANYPVYKYDTLAAIWYAVVTNNDPNWGYGSYDRYEALKMAEECAESGKYSRVDLVTVEEGSDPVAVAEETIYEE